MLFLHMFARSAMPGASSAKCSAQEAVTPKAAGELSTCWSSRTKKINANRIVEPHVNCILGQIDCMNTSLWWFLLSCLQRMIVYDCMTLFITDWSDIWLQDFQGGSSLVFFMLFLHIFATSAMSGASSGQCSTATAALPTCWSSSRKQNKTSWKADWCTSLNDCSVSGI